MLISEFGKYVLLDAQGCPILLVNRVVLETIQDFCKQTWILRRGLGIEITAPDASLNSSAVLDLSTILPADFQIVGITSFQTAGHEWPLERIQIYNHTSVVANNQYQKYYWISGAQEITVCPVKAGDAYMELAVAPLLSATEVDDDLFNYWLETLTAGAKGRLFRMPDKQWSDLKSASIAMHEYQRGVNDAKRLLKKSFTKQTITVNPRSDQVWLL